MSAILLSTLLVLGADPQVGTQGAGQTTGRGTGQTTDRGVARPTAPITSASSRSFDGQWITVSAVVNGRKMEVDRATHATIRGNTLTFSNNGREESLYLVFGPEHILQATPATAARGDQETGRRGTDTTPRPAGRTPAAGTTPPATARGNAGSSFGVYIATDEYLSLALRPGNTGVGAGPVGPGAAPATGTPVNPRSALPPAGSPTRPGTGATPGTGAGIQPPPPAGTLPGNGNPPGVGTSPSFGSTNPVSPQTNLPGTGTRTDNAPAPLGGGQGTGTTAGVGRNVVPTYSANDTLVLILRRDHAAGKSQK
jgi:hypothetical protein